MKIFEATILNNDRDFKGHRWNVALLTPEELDEYGECDTEQEYDDFVKKHTHDEWSDHNINFYAEECDMKDEDTIDTGDYLFGELYMLYS